MGIMTRQCVVAHPRTAAAAAARGRIMDEGGDQHTSWVPVGVALKSVTRGASL